MMSYTRSDRTGGARSVPSWIAGLSCGLILMVTPATVMLLGVGLAPTLFVRVLDGAADRSAFRAVLLCNATATIGPMIRLWRTGPPDLGRAMSILSQPNVLCLVWLAGAAAWVASELLTMLAGRYFVACDRRHAARLTSEIERLREEWGAEQTMPEA